ncbi:MAG TPA: alpha/beta hydrolase [Acidimicrobiales bacterium]|jgi:pimeloyl-ACP methyl ester carboxylesterase|nr:alpha/beta hydrolase [Acidimicrobiales bacterium]
MSYPVALHVTSRPATGDGAATVVFVHGSLDRGESFRRVMRRLPDVTAVAYDRRGYQGSRGGGVVDLGGHIEDLLAVMEEARAGTGPGPLACVGHSLGGDVVIGAALAEPSLFDAIGAFEPPMPWLGFRRDGTGSAAGPRWGAGVVDDPGEEAERFFSRMMSPGAWARLTDEGKAARRADGPALVADFRSLHAEGAPFDVTALSMPSVFGMGGPTSRPHHRRTVEWLGANVPGGVVYEIEGAQHGAHLSHPDHFAAMTRLVIERAATTTL